MALKQPGNKIRYAVVGAGSIAQEAVLPAFQNAENSQLAALVSGDPEKLRELGGRYGVPRTYSYEGYGECLASGEVDAVYIALPNHLHREYAEQAAGAGIHILCEKPLAQNEQECRRIIDAARQGGVKLMTAYRLHFEEGNLEAIRICQSGQIGEPRIFDSVFCQQVQEGNVRLANDVAHGGGPLFDMGIYCINAARYLFRDEPVEVTAFQGNSGEPRFEKSGEMMSVVLRFPHGRLASFTTSFGAAPTSRYTVVGTKGSLTGDPGYDWAKDLKFRTEIDGKTDERMFLKRDQFGPELVYFSDCILEDREPEASGEEGLVDVKIIEAAYRACESGRVVPISAPRRVRRPEVAQEIYRPPLEHPELVNAQKPSGGTKR